MQRGTAAVDLASLTCHAQARGLPGFSESAGPVSKIYKRIRPSRNELPVLLWQMPFFPTQAQKTQTRGPPLPKNSNFEWSNFRVVFSSSTHVNSLFLILEERGKRREFFDKVVDPDRPAIRGIALHRRCILPARLCWNFLSSVRQG
jgi:hypothetical protein